MKSFDSGRLLDEIGISLLVALQQNARLSYSELGRLVGLSAPAVGERVRRLEEAGVITGYRAVVDPAALGLTITAFIRLSTAGERAGNPRLNTLVQDLPEVVECHGITGTDSYIFKVSVSSVPHLGRLIDRLSPFGQLNTSIVLSTHVAQRALVPEREMTA